MSPGVVLSAGQPEKYSEVAGMVAVEAEAIDSREKCLQLYVPLVVRTPRYPSSPETGRPGVLL
jgi:hypothetical protein